MRSRNKAAAIASVALAAVGVGLFLLGRVTADHEPARADGYSAGQSDGYSAGRSDGYSTGQGDGYSDGYLAGLRAGQASGELSGRALQEGIELPADAQQPVQDAFTAGYVAGSNAAFSQYDGGWGLGAPYVVTLEAGHSPIAYRFSSRTPLQAGRNYYLCPDQPSVCEEPRP